MRYRANASPKNRATPRGGKACFQSAGPRRAFRKAFHGVLSSRIRVRLRSVGGSADTRCGGSILRGTFCGLLCGFEQPFDGVRDSAVLRHLGFELFPASGSNAVFADLATAIRSDPATLHPALEQQFLQ